MLIDTPSAFRAEKVSEVIAAEDHARAGKAVISLGRLALGRCLSVARRFSISERSGFPASTRSCLPSGTRCGVPRGRFARW